jgi:signal transduction histidine kinase/CheY-like chemotaxis protein
MRTRGRVLDSVREHAVPLVSIAFVAAVVAGAWHFFSLSGTLAEQLALQHAARYAQAVTQFPTLYTRAGPDPRQKAGAAPDNPTSFPGAVGISGGETSTPGANWIRLYGKRPLPWRREGRPKDDFEREALEHLEKNPGSSFHRIEHLDGHRVLRYATPGVMQYSAADIIQPSCLACHNSHPEKAMKTAGAPDGRSVLEVVVSLDEAIAKTRGRLGGTFALMAILALLASITLGAVARVSSKLKRRSAEALDLAAEQRRANQRLEVEVAERMRAEAEAARARDQALEASRLKSQFVDNISDGIRTPMNGIMGAVDLLLEGELSPGQQEYARIARSSSEALLVIVNDILDFSKIAYGDFALQSVDFGVRGLVGEVLDATRSQAHEKLLEVSSEVAANVPDALVGDPGRLLQIMLDLVDNAIKFTQEGEILVRVGLEWADTVEAMLHVEVADTGIGIAPEMKEAIFDAFTQAEASLARRHGGIGLGLSICAALVRKMGGRIWVDSTPGKGSTFHFTARFALGQPTAQPHARDEHAALRGVRALVVDPDPATRRVLVGLLESWKARATVADGTTPALFALRRAQEEGQPIPLVVVNGRLLAARDGHFVGRIRSDSRIAATRVVAFGASRPDGVDGWLATPVKGVELHRAVRTALGLGTVEPGAHADPHPESTPAPGEGASLTGTWRVLVVDDNFANRQLVSLWLTRRGHHVVTANDGAEAVAVSAQQPFDLVIMDLQMPGMDGVAATAAIRNRERETGGHLPIIALTALARETDRARCFKAGMDAYVTKPVPLPEFLATIEGVLAKHGRAASSAPPAAPDPFDSTTLARRIGDDETLLHSVQMFVGESRALLQQLRDGCDRRDATEVARAAQELRAALIRVGAEEAAAVAAELERQGAEGDAAGAQHTLERLEGELARLAPDLSGVS